MHRRVGSTSLSLLLLVSTSLLLLLLWLFFGCGWEDELDVGAGFVDFFGVAGGGVGPQMGGFNVFCGTVAESFSK